MTNLAVTAANKCTTCTEPCGKDTCCSVKDQETNNNKGEDNKLLEEDELCSKLNGNTGNATILKSSTQEDEELDNYRIEYEKARRLFSYDDAPEYLKHNPFIRSGYRGMLSTLHCIESVFWWTNETINIWSHIFGLVLFTGLAVNDIFIINIEAPTGDKVIVTFILFCFQTCMFLSSLYHTFSCRSEKDYDCFLNLDLFGIALALYAIYISGIYYAYWCDEEWGNFYMLSVTGIFMIAMILQIPKLQIDSNVKMIVFVAWALYGVIPTIHWNYLMGGWDNPLVQVLIPRVLGMYAISGTAFLIYLTKVPERWFPGKVDYLGHSHQWWHLFVLFALYYWHNSGMIYVTYRMNHACLRNMNIL